MTNGTASCLPISPTIEREISFSRPKEVISL
jgi:hypothetical protein